jgi:hypothetical protein
MMQPIKEQHFVRNEISLKDIDSEVGSLKCYIEQKHSLSS